MIVPHTSDPFPVAEAFLDHTDSNDNAHQFYYPNGVVAAEPEKGNNICLLRDSLNDISYISSDDAEDENEEEDRHHLGANEASNES